VNDTKCSSCGKVKHELKKRNSRALPGAVMYVCEDCTSKKYEPRGLIILAGRQFGQDHIKFWIKPQRYVGEPITLRELT